MKKSLMLDKKTTKLFDRFSFQAKKLHKYEKPLAKWQLKFSIEEENKAKTKLDYLTEEEISYSLDLFRPFYLKKNNDINFERICKKILENKDLESFHPKVKKFLDAWMLLNNKETNSSGANLKINEKQETSKGIFEQWLNEGYKHQEQYKEGSNKGLDRIAKFPFARDFSKIIFIDIFQKFCMLIIAFDIQVVQKILIKAKE